MMNFYLRCSGALGKLIACTMFFVCSFFVNNADAQIQYQRVYASSQTVGGGGLGGSVSSASLAADGNPQTASTINSPVLGSVYQQLQFASATQNAVHIKVEFNGSLLKLLGNTTVIFFNGSTQVGSEITLSNGLLGLGLQLLSGTNQYELIFTPQGAYNSVRITSNVVVGLAGSINLYEAYYNINATGTANCGAPVDELHGVNDPLGLLGVAAAVTNPQNAIDGDVNTYSTLAALAGAAEYTQQTFLFGGPSQVGDSVRIRISQPASLLDAALLNAIQIVAYNGADSVGVFNASNNLLSLRLLSGATNQAILSFAPGAVFDRVQVRFGGVLQVLSSLNIHEVQRVIPVPVLSAASTQPAVCTGGTFTLTATVPSGETITWYNPQQTVVGTGNSYTTPALNSSATYYVSASRTGCTNTSDILPIYIAVKTIPAVPTVPSGGASICAGQTATLSVTNPIDSLTYNWYTTATGGTPVGTGVSFVTPVLTDTTIYYVEASNGTCASPARATDSVKVSAIPAAAVVATATKEICAGSTASFSIQTPVSGITYNWYDATTGGNLVGTGTTFVTPQLAASTSYYVEATNAGGCSSATRTKVSVVVNPLPPVPVLVNATASVNPGQTVTFAVSNPSDTLTYNWYSTATGGTALYTGASFTTPALSATTSYYVEAVSSKGCTSSARALATATVVNDVVCGYATSQQTVGSGICALCSVTNGDNAVGSNLTDYATINTTLGVGGYGQLLKFGNTFYPGDSISLLLEVPGQLISATLLGGIGVETYSGNNPNGDLIILDSTIAHLQLLGTGGTNLFRVTLPTTKSFDGVAVTLRGLGVLSQLRVYAAQVYAGTPKLASGSALIYANAQRSPVFTGVLCALCGVTNPDQAVDGDTTTYSTVVSTLGLINTVGQLLKFPGSFSAGDSIQLDLEVPNQLISATLLGGLELETYTDNTPNGNPIHLDANTVRLQLLGLGGSNKFRVTLAANHSFNGAVVRIDGAANVLSSLRIYDAAVSYSNPTMVNVCNGSSATLTVVSPQNATIKWYTSASGGTAVFTGNSYTTPPVTTTTTYYIEASRYGCVNPARAVVNVVPNAIPAAPTPNATNVTICKGDSTKLYATAPSGVVFKWYTASTGGQAIYTGDTLIVKPDVTTTYYIESNNNTCASQSRTAVIVNVNAPAANVAVNPTSATIGVGQTASFTASSTTTGAVFNWYTTATGGTPVFTGPTFTTPALTASTNYYLEAVTAANCAVATRIVVPVTIVGGSDHPLPCDAATSQTNSVSPGLICLGCGVQNPSLAVDNDTTTGSTLSIVAGLVNSYVQQTLIFPFVGDPGDTVLISITSPSTIADIAALGGLQVGSYNGTTFNNDLTTVANNGLISVKLLAGAQGAIIKFVPQQAFDRVQVRLNSGLANLLTAVQLNYASRIKPSPVPVAASTAICEGQPASLTVTGPPNTTFKWYTASTGGSPVFIGNNFQTPALTNTTIYYVESVSTTGCASGNRTPVTVNVSAAPAAPAVTNSTVTVCSGTSATMGVQNPDNNLTYNWYTTATGGSPVATGASFTTGALTKDTVFYVGAANATGCTSSSRTQVSVTVNSQLPAPVVANAASASACNNGSTTLSVQNPQSGITYNWYDAATGGTLVGTGANFTTPSLTANTSYYVEAVSGTNCVSPRTAVDVTVIPSPAAPTVTVTPASATVNPGDPLSMTASSTTPDVTYNWYLQSTGGAPVFTGATYSPSGGISATTTYYVEAVTNTGSCPSARTAVTITVNPGTNLACDRADHEVHGPVSVCVLCSVSNPDDAVDADSVTRSAINIPLAALGGGYQQTLLFPSQSAAGDTVVIKLGLSPTLLSLGLLNSITVNSVLNGTDNNDVTNVGNSALIKVSLLTSGDELLIKFAPQVAFDGIKVQLTTALSLNTDVALYIYYASRQIAQPTVAASSVTICGGTSATLQATTTNGGRIEWYASPTGGSPITTGVSSNGLTSTFTTPALSATTTYYAQAVRDATNCPNLNRVPVTVIVNPAPQAPAVASASLSVCSNQTATLQVSNADPALTYNWYTAASGGTAIATNTSSYTTASLTANTTYYVEAVNASGCSSTARTAVAVTVNSLPAAPVVASGNPVICSGSTTLTIQNPDASITYNWYNVATGGTIVFTGSSFTTPVLTSTTSYYVEAVNASSCSNGTRTQVTVTVNPLPPAPAVLSNNVAICSGATASLAVQNADANTVYNWYTTATGGTPVLTGATVTTPALTANTTYYVEAAITTGCTSSSRTAVVVTVNALPGSPVLANAAISTCSDQSVTFSIQNPQSGTTYKWYDAAAGGNLLFTGENYTTPTLTANASYYVEATNGSGCGSATRTVATVTVNNKPSTPVIATGSSLNICANSTATLSVSNPQPNITYNWYDAATGGNLLYSGSTVTTSPLTANATYYVEAVSSTSGCTSGSRTSITVTVSGIPSAPVVIGNTAVCKNSTATLGINSPQAGITYNWYDAATGGNLLFSGTSITTPALTSSVTYYVEASNGTCGSTSRSQVTVTVNDRPDDPVIAATGTTVCTGQPATLTVSNAQASITYNWYDAASGGNLLFTGSSYTTGALTNNATYYVEAGNGTCSSAARTSVDVTVTSPPAVPVVASGNSLTVCTGSTATLNINSPQSGITYNWYDAATGGNLLFTGASFTTNTLTGTTTFYVEAVNGGGCASGARASVTVTVTNSPAAPVMASGNNLTICDGSTTALSISNPQAGTTYNWYDAATGGNLVFTGTTVTTPALNATTNYYVEAVNGSCASNSRSQITISVTSRPATPVVASSGTTACVGQPTTLTVGTVQSGITYSWYDAASGGNLLGTGSSFTTPVLNATTTYYVEAGNGTCASASRASATVTVVTKPAEPTVATAGTTACLGTATTLTVNDPQAGYTYNWYDAASGGNLLASGSSYTTGALAANTTYYVEAALNSGCVSSRGAVAVTVAAVPNAPAVAAANVSVCGGGSGLLQVQNPQSGYTYNWYNVATGGTALFSGPNYTINNVSGNTVYYVEAVNPSGCSSAARTSVNVNLAPALLTPVIANSTPAICSGSTVTLMASADGATAYSWYATATSNTVIASGSSFTSGPINSDTSFYVVATNANGCTSGRGQASITILKPLPAPVVSVTATTPTSVTFGWTAVTGATAYQVSTDGGATFTNPSSGANGLTHTITGLEPGQTVSIQVRALGSNSCQTGVLSDKVQGTTANPLGDQVFVPNVFTPNGDGRNDYFRPFGNTMTSAEMWIFSQWGNQIFHTLDGIRGWDGTAGGKPQPVGPYIYIIKVTLNDGTVITKKGAVNLIR